MRNIQRELDDSRNRILELNAGFIEESDKKFAQSQENRKQRIEDNESSQELLKNLKLDVSKITEYEEANAKEAQQTLE